MKCKHCGKSIFLSFEDYWLHDDGNVRWCVNVGRGIHNFVTDRHNNLAHAEPDHVAQFNDLLNQYYGSE